MIASTNRKKDKPSCENHKITSLVAVASELLAGIILLRLSSTRRRCTREIKVVFLPSRQISDHKHMFRRLRIFAFLDLKAAFGLVDCTILWRCLALKGVLEKFILLIQSLNANRRRWVRACGDISPGLTMRIGTRQGFQFCHWNGHRDSLILVWE